MWRGPRTDVLTGGMTRRQNYQGGRSCDSRALGTEASYREVCVGKARVGEEWREGGESVGKNLRWSFCRKEQVRQREQV